MASSLVVATLSLADDGSQETPIHFHFRAIQTPVRTKYSTYRQPLPPSKLKRDYELVRLYHPDKADATVSSEAAHNRFQAIAQAYDILRGKKPTRPSPAEKATEATTASRRAMHVRRHRDLYERGPVDDTWKDRLILAGVAFAVGVIVIQTTLTRRAAINEALDQRSAINYSTRRQQKLDEDSRLASSSSDTTTP